MRKLAFVAAVAFVCAASAHAQSADVARWQRQAQAVTIIRDDWGIAHVYGKTDADVVFGAIYAQAEDDFNRVETNYINAMGRLAEAEGASAIYRDLRMKIFIHPDSVKAKYNSSPAWLKTLMNAWADGLNFYLHTHPGVKPRVITRFEPWMALTFSEGSIGGDIERVNLNQLEAFYGRPAGSVTGAERRAQSPEPEDDEPRGSNGIAIAPSNTVSGRALLLINPHTSFYFRSELQMVSEEGLNAYGASTWGQFFIYQGFNDKAGWMHTSSSVDNIDEYLETITRNGARITYKYGAEERPVVAERIVVRYKTDAGMARREFTVFRTHHGPIVRELNGKWVAVRLMQEPVKALTQSYLRTKAKNYQEYRQTMELHTNSSNNTLFADAEGNIAYFHANWIPRRDMKFDWTRPVDGSDPATDWKDILTLDESPDLLNPASGWVYNTNNHPWSAAGPSSLRKENYPPYVDAGSENARGLHAMRVLTNRRDFSLDGLVAAAYDSYLPAFEPLIPRLVGSFDASPDSALKARVAEQVDVLSRWDYRWGVSSIATTLAVEWFDDLRCRAPSDRRRAAESGPLQFGERCRPPQNAERWMAESAPDSTRLLALVSASDKLTRDFGTWKTPWGDKNRFQRLSNEIVAKFDDAGPSIPVMFTSATYGSLASFGARAHPGTRKIYGTSGNSFVAVVEFGKDSVRARAVTAGGESGVVGSRHFNDQAERYATGNLRPVYFYRHQLQGHTEREYNPGK